MAKLYEIAESYRNLAVLLDNEEVSKEMLEVALTEVEGDLTDKLQNITYIIKNNSGDITAIDEEIKRLQARKKSIENTNSNLENYMYSALKFSGKNKIQTSFNTWSIRKNPVSVVVSDESKISKEFIREEIKTTIDKKAVKEALLSGVVVEGAELKQGEKLVIK